MLLSRLSEQGLGRSDMILCLTAVHFSSVAQSRPTLCDPMDCSTPGSPVLTNSRSLLTLMSIASVTASNHLILCHALFLLPSIFPSISIFSNESVLHIRWPKYWSFMGWHTPFLRQETAVSPIAWQSNKAILFYFTPNCL